MASISKDANGNRTIQFVGSDTKRRSIRLGKVNAKLAESIKVKVEALQAATSANLSLDAESARWIASIGDDLAAKLAAVGLIPERRSAKLGNFLTVYLNRRRVGSKPNTIANIERVVKDLLHVFDANMDLRAITPDDALRLKAAYHDKQLAPATIHRQLKFAKMLFAAAVTQKYLTENPFADVKLPNAIPLERRRYITEADTEKLLSVANPTWRIIIALCRYAGLRCPSEVCSLRWEHIDFATDRSMTVSSPKTECHAGKEYRVVPIFPRLRPYLEEAFELAEAGEEFVVGGPTGASWRASGAKGWKGTNLRTTVLKLIRRAGLKAWPKPFHNLRASCETDLMQNHPIHVVTAWIGNTPNVAIGHYLQTLESDFTKAVGSGAKSGAVVVQKPVQSASAGNRQKEAEELDIVLSAEVMSNVVSLRRLLSDPDIEQIHPRGVEPLTFGSVDRYANIGLLDLSDCLSRV